MSALPSALQQNAPTLQTASGPGLGEGPKRRELEGGFPRGLLSRQWSVVNRDFAFWVSFRPAIARAEQLPVAAKGKLP